MIDLTPKMVSLRLLLRQKNGLTIVYSITCCGPSPNTLAVAPNTLAVARPQIPKGLASYRCGRWPLIHGHIAF
jgi:hypothetical protein